MFLQQLPPSVLRFRSYFMFLQQLPPSVLRFRSYFSIVFPLAVLKISHFLAFFRAKSSTPPQLLPVRLTLSLRYSLAFALSLQTLQLGPSPGGAAGCDGFVRPLSK